VLKIVIREQVALLGSYSIGNAKFYMELISLRGVNVIKRQLILFNIER